jgi:hypothetical protein
VPEIPVGPEAGLFRKLLKGLLRVPKNAEKDVAASEATLSQKLAKDAQTEAASRVDAAAVPNLHGKSLRAAEDVLTGHKFAFAKETGGGYRRYASPDGSEIWIRPDGEVVRTGPKIDPGPNQKNYRDRYDQYGNRLPRHDEHGNPLNNHSTGERVKRP